eukprot:980762-Pleurochrysis_carterae.AAC.2
MGISYFIDLADPPGIVGWKTTSLPLSLEALVMIRVTGFKLLNLKWEQQISFKYIEMESRTDDVTARPADICHILKA